MLPTELARLIEGYTQSLRADPAQAETYVRCGMARYALGDFAAAIADFTQALEVRPDFPEALNNRGVSHQALGAPDAALADFDAALRLKPDYPEAFSNRGSLRQTRGDLAGALADLDAALRLNPRYAEAFNNRGMVRKARGELPAALADLSAAIRLNPYYAEAYDNRGGVFYLQWKHAEAIADFTRALKLYGPAAGRAVLCRLHLHRGDARYHKDDTAGFGRDYWEGFQRDPDLAARLVVERLALDIRCNLSLVLRNCAEHIQANPDDTISLGRRGLVYYLLGRDADAQADFAEFSRKNQTRPSLLPGLIDAAKRYRDQHGPVIGGDSLPAAFGSWAHGDSLPG